MEYISKKSCSIWTVCPCIVNKPAKLSPLPRKKETLHKSSPVAPAAASNNSIWQILIL